MVSRPRRGAEGDLQSVVDAPGQLLQVAIRGLHDQTRHKQVREHAMDVQAALLAGWRRAEDTNDRYLLHRRATKVREADVEVFERAGEVVVYDDDPT